MSILYQKKFTKINPIFPSFGLIRIFLDKLKKSNELILIFNFSKSEVQKDSQSSGPYFTFILQTKSKRYIHSFSVFRLEYLFRKVFGLCFNFYKVQIFLVINSNDNLLSNNYSIHIC